MAGAPQQCVQTRYQFAQIEGLRQVVVGPGFQPRDAVVDGIPRGQHANRDLVSECTQCGHDRNAVEFRHLHIENQRIVGFVRQQPQSLFAARSDPNVKARMAQSARDGSPDVRVVIDHQHRAAGGFPRRRLRCAPECRLNCPRCRRRWCRRSGSSGRPAAGEYQSGPPWSEDSRSDSSGRRHGSHPEGHPRGS